MSLFNNLLLISRIDLNLYKFKKLIYDFKYDKFVKHTNSIYKNTFLQLK